MFDWGTITVIPFLREQAVIRRGDVLDLGVRLLAHDGEVDREKYLLGWKCGGGWKCGRGNDTYSYFRNESLPHFHPFHPPTLVLIMRRNADVADYLRLLHDFLVIGGHPETYAGPYLRIANVIANHTVDVEVLARDRRLKRIPGLGWMMEKTIMEYLKTGTSSKFDGYARQTPRTVLELMEIPGVGVKTTAILFQSFGISSLAALRAALQDGWLQDLKIFSPKLVERMQDYVKNPVI